MLDYVTKMQPQTHTQQVVGNRLFPFGNQDVLHSVPLVHDHRNCREGGKKPGSRLLGAPIRRPGRENYKKSPEYLVVPESEKVFLKKRMGHVKRAQELIQKISQWPTWDNQNNKISNAGVRLLPK